VAKKSKQTPAATEAPLSLTLALPKPPSVNNLFLNIPGRGRAPSGEYKAWKAEAGAMVRLQGPTPMRGPVSILLVIDEGNRCDRDNLMKAPLDLLVELGIIEGDGPGIVKEITIRSGEVDGALVTITQWAAP
jgi:Holliday junction resolvase RusA-like endonuclease